MNRVTVALDRLSQSLGRVPSMTFALLFLALIPGFALIYWAMPYNFYHSTVKYENALASDANEIVRRLLDEVIGEFQRAHGTFSVDRNGWRINIRSALVNSLRPDGNAIMFTLTIPLRRVEPTEASEIFVAVGVRLAVDGPMWTKSRPGDRWPTIIQMPTFTSPEPLPVDLHVLFPYQNSPSLLPSGTQSGTVFMPLSQPLNTALVEYTLAITGFPSGATGSFARMFYFSAVTVTTLGYGDIVPITTAARLVVAMEPILGVVLMGLFINSLFQDRDRRSREP